MNTDKFEKYQMFTEKTIYDLSQQVIELEKKLNMFSNLLEISKYINQYIKDPNLFPLINDMLIGVFGARYSTIFIKENNEYYEAGIKSTSEICSETVKKLIINKREGEFIINSDTPIFVNQNNDEFIYSCMGVPVKVDGRLLGFILIQHKERNYFNMEHVKFLSLIGNHIGVAIENNFLYEKIKESAYRDGLTDIYNKLYFFETLRQLPDIMEQDYSIVIVDLDNFKIINDTYGHPYGDAVLRKVAEIIKRSTRANDIVARYGGDEIIIYLNNFTEKEKVKNRIELLRKEIAQTQISCEGIDSYVTASFGVYCKKGEELTLDEVIKKADDIMYHSKKNGKNKVSIE